MSRRTRAASGHAARMPTALVEPLDHRRLFAGVVDAIYPFAARTGDTDTSFYVDFDGHTVFAAQKALYATDGSSSGTRKLGDLTGISGLADGVIFNDQLVLALTSGRLIVTDGTAGATRTIFNGGSGTVRSVMQFQDRVYFTHGNSLLMTNPSLTSVSVVGSTATAFTSGELVVSNDKLYASLTTPAVGGELFVIDSAGAAPRLVADIRPGTAGSNPNQFVLSGSDMFFTAIVPSTTTPLTNVSQIFLQRRQSSTPVAATNLTFNSAAARVLGAANGRLFFTDQPQRGAPVPLRTVAADDPTPLTLPVSSPSYTLVPFKSAMFFAYNGELWRSDGTVAGTAEVADSTVTGTVDAG